MAFHVNWVADDDDDDDFMFDDASTHEGHLHK